VMVSAGQGRVSHALLRGVGRTGYVPRVLPYSSMCSRGQKR
jgi:hypothetical protein